jgi:hypothetical protein
MELMLGAHVREGDRRLGRLAGLELEPAGLNIRRIIFSPDGELGPQAQTRPLGVVTVEGGDIVCRTGVEIAPMPATAGVVLLSHATRLRRGGHAVGRLAGVEVDPATRSLTGVFGRRHWWSRRFSIAASQLDCSTPGEVRAA